MKFLYIIVLLAAIGATVAVDEPNGGRHLRNADNELALAEDKDTTRTQDNEESHKEDVRLFADMSGFDVAEVEELMKIQSLFKALIMKVADDDRFNESDRKSVV